MLRRISSLLLVVAAAVAFSDAAAAQSLGTYSWKPPKKVQEDMEKDRVPGIFLFDIPAEVASMSITWNFAQPQVMKVLSDGDFKACKISIVDSKSSRPWGTYQKLADEFGVGLTTTLVVCAYDRYVMALVSQPVKRDEFIVNLKGWKARNEKRIKESDACGIDCDQIEKWLEEKKFGDASRRMKMVLDKADEDRMSAKAIERAKAVDEKVGKIGEARLAEGKALFEAGKKDEAKPILEEVVSVFGRYEYAKEAKELLKKMK